MAEFTETTTTTYSVACPDCQGDKVKKHGFQRGEQRYFCKGCKKAFRAGGKAEGRRMDAEMMGSAIRDFYTGKSYKQIADGLKEEYDLEKEPFHFAEGVNKIEDLSAGMKLPGVVTNVTDFGAFVDVGVHQDGLVHISQLADRFVRNPSDVVKVQQQVWVTVLEVGLERRRISLSMKGDVNVDVDSSGDQR